MDQPTDLPPLYFATYDGIEFAVQFDGRVDRDRDLLCTSRIPTKRYDAPVQQEQHTHQSYRMHRVGISQGWVLRALSQKPRTVTELAQVTGLTEKAVRMVLENLQQARKVRVVDWLKGEVGHPRGVYALAEAA